MTPPATDEAELRTADVKEYTVTEELIMEVLTARRRTGETWWTFTKRAPITKALKSLEEKGFVTILSGQTNGTQRGQLSELGWNRWSDPKYMSPLEIEMDDLAREW